MRLWSERFGIITVDAAINRDDAGGVVLLTRTSNCLAFAVWVSICAATPEFLWQGLVVFFRHFTLTTAGAPLLIGTLLAFFVEPLMERARHLSWRPHSQSAWPAFVGLPISIAFGFVAVCIHDSVSAYVSHPGTSPAFTRALAQLPEWAAVPFIVTLAWFAGRFPKWLAVGIGALACAAVMAVARVYGWNTRDAVTTIVPAWLLVALGQQLVSKDSCAKTIDRLARATAGVAIGWLALSWTIDLVLGLTGLGAYQLYDPTEFAIDIRFYLGWSLGIVLAPNPLAIQSP